MGISSIIQRISIIVLQSFRAQPTLVAENVPTIYREPGVLTGYRPIGKPLPYYFMSLFCCHNESINIWTHLLAAVLFIVKVCHVINENEEVSKNGLTEVFLAFGFCTVGYTFLSALAHTFHTKSPRWHYVWFQLDYCGIGLYGLGKCILFLYCSCPSFTFHYINDTYLAMNTIFGWVLMTGCCIAKLKYRRPYPFRRKLMQLCSGALQSGFGFIPLASRYVTCAIDPTCMMSSLSHHSTWLVTLFISLYFFSSHMPEKKFPGKFDFIGQGHHIFHIFIALTTFLQYSAALNDVKNHDNAHITHHVTGLYLTSIIVTYLLGSALIILMLGTRVDRRIQEDMKNK